MTSTLDAPVQRGFTPQDKRSIATTAAVVVGLHVLGWGVLVLAVAPQRFDLGSTGVLGVGGLVLIGLLVERLHITSGPLAWLASWDLDHVGFGIVGLFVVTWGVALAVWRYGRVEERYSA